MKLWEKHLAVDDLFKAVSLCIAIWEICSWSQTVIPSWSECVTMVTLGDHGWVIDLPQSRGCNGTAAIHHMLCGWRLKASYRMWNYKFLSFWTHFSSMLWVKWVKFLKETEPSSRKLRAANERHIDFIIIRNQKMSISAISLIRSGRNQWNFGTLIHYLEKS